MFQKARIAWLELAEAGLVDDHLDGLEQLRIVPHVVNELVYPDGTVLYWHPDLGQWRWRNPV